MNEHNALDPPPKELIHTWKTVARLMTAIYSKKKEPTLFKWEQCRDKVISTLEQYWEDEADDQSQTASGTLGVHREWPAPVTTAFTTLKAVTNRKEITKKADEKAAEEKELDRRARHAAWTLQDNDPLAARARKLRRSKAPLAVSADDVSSRTGRSQTNESGDSSSSTSGPSDARRGPSSSGKLTEVVQSLQSTIIAIQERTAATELKRCVCN